MNLESALQAMPKETLRIPACDVNEAAQAALALVTVVDAPERRERFAALPQAKFSFEMVARLYQAALALLHCQAHTQNGHAEAAALTLKAPLLETADQFLSDVHRYVEVALGEVPRMAAERTTLRDGASPRALVRDLQNVADLLDQYRSQFPIGMRAQAAPDAANARVLAARLIAAQREHLAESATKWIDLRNRAWTRLSDLCTRVRDAGATAFQDTPEEAMLFSDPPLLSGKKRQRRSRI